MALPVSFDVDTLINTANTLASTLSPVEAARRVWDVLIIGAGPAGMEFAVTARQRGHEVTVFEKSDKIGGMLTGYAANDLANRADLQSVISYYETMAAKLGIELRLGTAVDPRLMRDMLHTYDVAVIATGTALHRAAQAGQGGVDQPVHRSAPGRFSPVSS